MSQYAMKGGGLNFAERRRFLWIVLLIGIVLIAVIAATATTLAPLRFDELARQATAVVRVQCSRVSTETSSGELWTVTEFYVKKSLKGAVVGVVSIRMPGGRGDGVMSRVDGVPTFSTGEEAYLFLWRREEEPYRVLGWTQGTFRVARNSRSGTERVTQESASGAVFDAKSRTFRHDGIRDMSAEEFEQKLHRALAANPAGE